MKDRNLIFSNGLLQLFFVNHAKFSQLMYQNEANFKINFNTQTGFIKRILPLNKLTKYFN